MEDPTSSQSRPKRVTDTSAREAKLAVAEVASRFEPWRSAIARIAARARGATSESERRAMCDECSRIEGEIRMSRTEVILELAEAPRKVTSNSRVVDIERAFENVEAALRDAKLALTSTFQRPS